MKRFKEIIDPINLIFVVFGFGSILYVHPLDSHQLVIEFFYILFGLLLALLFTLRQFSHGDLGRRRLIWIVSFMILGLMVLLDIYFLSLSRIAIRHKLIMMLISLVYFITHQRTFLNR